MFLASVTKENIISPPIFPLLFEKSKNVLLFPFANKEEFFSLTYMKDK